VSDFIVSFQTIFRLPASNFGLPYINVSFYVEFQISEAFFVVVESYSENFLSH
jgi:hypothetical protein